jgi:probable HAF family extracellular repeat protein
VRQKLACPGSGGYRFLLCTLITAVSWIALGNVSRAQPPIYTAVSAYYPGCQGPGCGYYIDWLTVANGLNDLGQVVGTCGNDGGGWPCMVANGAELTDFFSTSDFICNSVAGGGGDANAVNSRGQSVGWCEASSHASFGAWLADAPAGHGANTPVTNITGNCGGAEAFALNDSGQVVGLDCSGMAFVYAGGSVTDLGTLGGSGSIAYGINASGTITGYANLPGDSTHHAFLYASGAMTDLGTLGGTNSSGAAINSGGVVVGTSDTVGGSARHAFLFAGNAFTDLGTLGGTNSSANAINDAGQVVGASDTTDGVQHAVLWQNGTLTDLNSVVAKTGLSGALYYGSAVAINSNGVILTENGDLLVPVTFTPLALDFGSQPIGTATRLPITVANTGRQPFAVSSVSVSVPLVQSNDCPSAIGPGASCTITVTFTPPGPDALSGTVTVISNAINFPLAVSGTGEVTASLSASATTMPTGVPVTLTWKSSPGASCVATSAPAGGAWNGKLPSSSGTQAVNESSPGTYMFTVACALGKQSVKAQTQVVFKSTSNGGGGGGALDVYTLAMLIAMTLAQTRLRGSTIRSKFARRRSRK